MGGLCLFLVLSRTATSLLSWVATLDCVTLFGAALGLTFLRVGFGVFSTNRQKARISRNPKTGEKVNTPEKKTIHFKMSKDLFIKINNEE